MITTINEFKTYINKNIILESSWDTISKSDIKLHGFNIYFRYIYDTPNNVAIEMYVSINKQELNKLFNKQFTDIEYSFDNCLLLNSYSKEANYINAEDMNDSDVYDLFDNKIVNNINKYEKNINLFKNNIIKNNSIE